MKKEINGVKYDTAKAELITKVGVIDEKVYPFERNFLTYNLYKKEDGEFFYVTQTFHDYDRKRLQNEFITARAELLIDDGLWDEILEDVWTKMLSADEYEEIFKVVAK